MQHLVTTAEPFISLLARMIQARLRVQPPRTAAQDRIVGDSVLTAIRGLLN